jgi:hypothetical protein
VVAGNISFLVNGAGRRALGARDPGALWPLPTPSHPARARGRALAGAVYGDVDGDGSFDTADCLLTQEYFNNIKLGPGRTIGCPANGGNGCRNSSTLTAWQLKQMDQVSDPQAGATVADFRDFNFMLQVLGNNLRFVANWSQAYDAALGLSLRVRLVDRSSQPAAEQCGVRFILATAANAGTRFTTSAAPTKEGLLVDAAPLGQGWYGIQSAGPTLAEERIPFVFLVETVDAFGLSSTERRFPFYATTLPPYDASYQSFVPFDNATVNGGGTTTAEQTTTAAPATSGVPVTSGAGYNGSTDPNATRPAWEASSRLNETTSSLEEGTTSGMINGTASSVEDNATRAIETTSSLVNGTTSGLGDTDATDQKTGTTVTYTGATSLTAVDTTSRGGGHSAENGATSAIGAVTASQSTSTAVGAVDTTQPDEETPSPSQPAPPLEPMPASKPFPIGVVAAVAGAVAGVGLAGSLLAFFLLNKKSKKKSDGTQERLDGPEEFPRLRIRIDPMYLWYAAIDTQVYWNRVMRHTGAGGLDGGVSQAEDTYRPPMPLGHSQGRTDPLEHEEGACRRQ